MSGRAVTWASWAALVSVLLVSLFGVTLYLKSLAFIISFICGIIGVIYLNYDKSSVFPADLDYLDNPLEQTNFSIQLPKVLDLFEKDAPPKKFDQRITGSETVDTFLNEIVNIVIADYVSPWYEVLTADDELTKYSLKQTVQAAGANLANRMKSVDWVQLLATRFPEEITTHLKLFKQARVRMKHISTLADKETNGSYNKLSPKKGESDKKPMHRRNKSETDLGWFSSNNTQIFGKSKFYASTENLSGKTLKDIFFDLECVMEDRKMCRDIFCMDSDKEYALLCELSEAILYLIAPEEAWQCTSMKLILIDLLAGILLKPLLNLISDPDNINRIILRTCCKDTGLPSELFLIVIRCCEDAEELDATLELVQKEMQKLHSRDSGGECELPVRQQLSSLLYLKRVIHARRAALLPQELLTSATDSRSSERVDTDIQNSLQFLSASSSWRTNAQYLMEIELQEAESSQNSKALIESLRASALELCDTYLAPSKPPLLGVPEDTYGVLVRKINTENEEFVSNPVACFDDLQKCIFDALEDVPVWQTNQSADMDFDSGMPADVTSDPLLRDESGKTEKLDRRKYSGASTNLTAAANVSLSHSDIDKTSRKACASYLQASIIETALVQDKGRTFGIYAIAVTRLSDNEVWHIYRRYSDFYDLNSSVKDRWPELAHLPFPGKKTFQNTSRSVLERRKMMLNSYLQSLSTLSRQTRYADLLTDGLLGGFLSQQNQSEKHSSSIDALFVNSLRAGMRTLKSMPDQLANTVDGVMDGISKVFHGKTGESYTDGLKFTLPFLQDEGDESVALRLLEEALGLRGMWLRRHLLAPVRTLLADHINKKVLEYVSTLTSPRNIVQYLKHLKQWLLNGVVVDYGTRDAATRARARVAAKVALLAACSDELRHIVGTDTARRGLLTVFQLFQTQEINKRLIFVLLEATMSNLFPDNNTPELFRRLYSGSPRVHAVTKKQSTL